MATILPDSDALHPLGSIPATASSTPATGSKPVRPKRRAHHRPKLTVSDVTTAAAIDSALSIGRRVAARGIPHPGHEAAALTAFLARMRRWAADVAPHYDIAEFAVAAQALAGSRELRPVLGNLRLAELRQVTGGWEELQMRKRLARKRRREVADQEEEHVDGREDVAEHSRDGERAEEDGHGSKDVHALMNDPDVKIRIERNRQLALQRRLKVAARAAPAKAVAADEMEIDPNDVIEACPSHQQEDIDMDVLDEITGWHCEQQKDADQPGKEETRDLEEGSAAGVAAPDAVKTTEACATPTDQNSEEQRASVENADKGAEANHGAKRSDVPQSVEPKGPESRADASQQRAETVTDDGQEGATAATGERFNSIPAASTVEIIDEAATSPVDKIDTMTDIEVAMQKDLAKAAAKSDHKQKNGTEQSNSDQKNEVAQEKDADDKASEEIDIDILGEFEATKDEDY